MNIFILCLLVILYQNVNSEISQLRHVHVIFRHGDRGPMHIFPTDSNKIDKWPDGLGQLTSKGIKEHFQLGLWLRKRYHDFLGNDMNYSLIYVRSTDIDRALMSAESNLAGLFYNYSREVIDGLKWHPYPIHTVDAKSDVLLLAKDTCPIYEDLCMKLYDDEYFRNKFQPYQSTLDMLRIKTGMHALTFYATWKIYDTLFCEKQHNLTVDDWVTDDIWKKLEEINNLNWELQNYGRLSRLTGGFLLRTIVRNLTWLAEPDPSLTHNRSKMIMYSGHDIDIAPLATLLGVFDNIQPSYTACILIELHYIPSGVDDKWAVRVIYKNYTDSSGSTYIPSRIVPGCPSTLCPLNRFLKLMKTKFMSKKEYKETCFPKESVLFMVQILFAVVAVTIVLLIVIMFVVRSFRKPAPQRYSRVTTEPNIN